MDKITGELFIEKLFELLPETMEDFKLEERYLIDDYGKILQTVVIEDIFMKRIFELLKENKEAERLKTIFDYFEEVCRYGEKALISQVFAIAVLENIASYQEFVPIAKSYMGDETLKFYERNFCVEFKK